MSRTVVRRVARRLRARFGVWVLHEARNKVLGWPRALAGLRRERAEVRRLSAATSVPASEVTTVIATYRRPESLVRAVESALDQDHASHTVIVVDDGGGLPELPADPRLVAVSLSANTGRAGLVRNVGLGLARSPYVAFLDDDNEWYPHHLSVALAALGDDPALAMVYTAADRVRPDGTRFDVLSTPFSRESLADNAYVDTNTFVLRAGGRTRFSRLHRSRTTLPGEDWELVWRLSRHRKVQHVPVATVRYVVNPESYFSSWNDDPDVAAGPADPREDPGRPGSLGPR